LAVTGSVSAIHVIAVVFAPGTTLAGQLRDSLNENKVENYLEATNSTSTTYFVAGDATAVFNDRLIPVLYVDLIPLVEKRVAREAMHALKNYYASSDADPAKRYFPYAAPLGNAATGCQESLRRGHLPVSTGAGCSTAPLTLPSWFTESKWENHIYYTVADACTSSNQGCDTGGFLTVGAATNVNALLVSAGRRLDGTKCAATLGVPYNQVARPTTNIFDYMDSVTNTDGDDIYDAVGAPVTSSRNDQMFVVSP
jgi:hypothetical protein